MQREYEFRGQQFDDKQWIYGSLLEDDIIVTKGATSVDDSYIGFTDEWSSVLAETVGQYTGMNDKNSKKIYEGDKCLVKRTCVLAEGYIKFQDGCFIFIEFRTRNILTLFELERNGFKIEVIGNIHDNPELLGKEKEDGRSIDDTR